MEIDINKLKEIPGYDGYFATSTGEIYSLKRHNQLNKLVSFKNKYGSEIVILSNNGKTQTFTTARLVLMTYGGELPAPLHLLVARNKDGNLDNNDIQNLEWIVCETTSEYDPSKSLKRGVIKPDFVKNKMQSSKQYFDMAAELERRKQRWRERWNELKNQTK